MKVVVAGAGAFGKKHLDGIKNIDGVDVAAVVDMRHFRMALQGHSVSGQCRRLPAAIRAALLPARQGDSAGD